jgi:hypothetical protein
MKKQIVEFIIKAIQDWDDNTHLGEEIRVLEETLEEIQDNNPDHLIGTILLLIYIFKQDEELGKHIRGHYISFRLYIKNVETNP